MPTALATLYCTVAEVEACLSVVGVDERLNDSGGPGGTPTGTEDNYLAIQGLNYAASRINMYCLAHYSKGSLADSQIVNQWAVCIAARWLSKRRGNPAPAGLEEDYKEMMEELKEVKRGNLDLNDVALREPAWPYWSNMKVDTRYRVNQSRVVRRTSEDSPMDYAQKIDRM